MPEISLFRSVSPSSYMGSQDYPFSWLVDLARTPEEVRTKEGAPLLVFARSTDPGSRKGANVTHATLAVFDVDGVAESAFSTLLQSLRVRKLAYLWHTTASHKIKGQPGYRGRYRLMMPISRDIGKGEWKRTRKSLIKHVFGDLEVQPDAAANDIGRLYYVPSVTRESADNYAWEHHEGDPIDVDSARLLTPDTVDSPVCDRSLTATDLKAWLPKYKRRKSFRGDVHDAAKRLIAGDTLAESGDRERTIRDLTWALAVEFPDATPESVRALFTPSIQLMEAENPTGCPTLEEVEDRFARALEKVLETRAEGRRGLSLTESENLLRGLWGTSRGPADAEEIAADAAMLGMTLDEYLNRGLIFRAAKQIFIRNIAKHRYEVFQKDDALAGARQLLVAIPHVEFTRVTERGVVPRTFDELTLAHGAILQRVEQILSAEHTSVDRQTSTLCLSPCPLHELAPEYDKWTDDWLRVLAGRLYPSLITWLAKFTDLDQPLPVVYLEGAPNTGKSLLAASLAALYGNGKPIDAEDVMGGGAFNATLTGNPLVVADEYFPVDWKGNPNTHLLRKFVQERTKTLRVKYAHDTILRGCHRVLITANHGDALTFKTGATLTPNDIKAIEDRLIHIHTPERAAQWIKGEEDAGRLDHSYVTNKTFAKHVMWLRDNHESESQGRFYVPGYCPSLVNKMATSGDVADGICEILVRALLRTDDMAKTAGAVFLHYDRKDQDVQLCVIPKGISECWASFRLAAKRPTPTEVNRVLGSLKSGGRQIKRGQDRPRVTYVNLDRLIAYAEQAGIAADSVEERFIDLANKELPS